MSSEYSYAEVRIKNPVLLDILKRYKEQGAFKASFHDKIFAPNEDYAIYLEDQRVLKFTKTPAALDEVFDYIIDMLNADWLDSTPPDNELIGNLQEELTEKRDEIDGAYESVRWLTYYYDGHEANQHRYRFDRVPYLEKYSITYQGDDEGEDPDYELWKFNNGDTKGW